MTSSLLRWSTLVLVLAAFTLLVRAQEGSERSFTVSAHKYAFSPAHLEVRKDDLVRVSFSTSDIPHSFTIDRYRIAKRVSPASRSCSSFARTSPGASLSTAT